MFKPRSLGTTTYVKSRSLIPLTYIPQRFLHAEDPLTAYISFVNQQWEFNLSRHAHYQWGKSWEAEWQNRKTTNNPSI